MTTAVFLGTPDEAVPSLHRLLDVADVALVITRPDRARGRSRRLRPPPVKEAAESVGLPVSQPTSAAEVHEAMASVDADLGVVTAYGRLVRPEVLTLPEFGFVNVHFSLLPRWRGASPVVRAILAGDEITGVTIMQMDEGLDTGPILATSATPIDATETAGELTTRLAELGADLLAETVPKLGAIEARPQPADGVTAAGKVSRDEAFVDPTRHSAASIVAAVRAFNPRPGAWGRVDGERCKLWRAHPADGGPEPGLVIERDGEAVVGTPDGAVALDEVQPASRAPMAGAAWLRGRRGETRFR